MAIPAALCVQLLIMPNLGESSTPRGGVHGYFHAIHRAAVHRGAVIRTSCPVDEILIDDGIAEPGDWWYASPYYIPQQGKISARRD